MAFGNNERNYGYTYKSLSYEKSMFIYTYSNDQSTVVWEVKHLKLDADWIVSNPYTKSIVLTSIK